MKYIYLQDVKLNNKSDLGWPLSYLFCIFVGIVHVASERLIINPPLKSYLMLAPMLFLFPHIMPREYKNGLNNTAMSFTSKYYFSKVFSVSEFRSL